MSKNSIEKISAGSHDFNKWLYGGYERGVITMLAGCPGSGKTNLALLVSCSQAKKGNKVIFIDTEGGFSPLRVKQIVGELELEKVLENIFLLEPTNFEEQKDSFEKLLKQVGAGQIGAIVIDGMAMLYRLELGNAVKSKEEDKIREVNREIARQMRVLAELARKQGLPIIITNQVYNEFLSEDDLKKGVKRGTNIVGGDLFKYWSKCIIELKNSGGRRSAHLLKHRSLPEKKMNFLIRDEGIFRKGRIL